MLTVRYRVGIIRGGVSSYEKSIAHGHTLLSLLDERQYHPIDIFIDRQGIAHVAGIPIFLEKTIPTLDVVYNTLFISPLYVRVKDLASSHEIPHLGTQFHTYDREGQESMLQKILGLKVPKKTVVRKEGADFEKEAHTLWRIFPKPLVVSSQIEEESKPLHHFGEFLSAIAKRVLSGNDAVVREHIEGQRVFVPVIEGMRGEEHFIPIAIHAHPSISKLFRPLHQFSDKDRVFIEAVAVSIYKALNLKRYAQFEFSLSPRGLFLINIEQNPPLDEHTPFASALSHAGITPKEFVHHLLTQALRGL
jgi:hypothetical protein